MADWYDDWATGYVASLGVSEQTAEAVFAWRDALLHLGATRGRLDRVTRLVLTTPPVPRWPNEHLDALQRHLADVQRAEAEAAWGRADAGPGCAVCGGSGWVIVPHPADWDAGGRWVNGGYSAGRPDRPKFRTAAVACGCDRGRLTVQQLAQRHADRPAASPPAPLTLAEYERVHPHWRRVVGEKEAAEQALLRAKLAADVTAADLARRVADGMRAH